MRKIPAIDLINGELVRLEQGEYAKKKVYDRNPMEWARQLKDAGIYHLHLVDLDAAKYGDLRNLKLVESIKKELDLVIDYGGGIKSLEMAQSVLNAGAEQVNIGSLIIRDFDAFQTIAEELGTKVIASLDVRGEEIAVDAWQEGSGQSLFDWIPRIRDLGIRDFCCTDISRDGMLNGPAVDLYKNILQRFPGIGLIASGGVSHSADLRPLEDLGCEGVIIGKALLEGRIKLEELC